MAHISADRVKETTATTGTGALSLSGTASATYRTFASQCAVGDTIEYVAVHESANEWECGVATYSATNTLTRTTVLDGSNGASAVNFSAGSKTVFNGVLAKRRVEAPISVKWFGAKGDGTTDDTAALQNTINYAVSVGGTVYLPRGKYRITSTLSIDESAVTDDADATRISIVGEGAGASHIVHNGAATAINYTGGTGGGLHAYLRFHGFRIDGTGAAGQHGMTLNAAAYLSIEDVTITECADGLIVIDCLSFAARSCVFRFNKRGVVASFATGSRPNNITFQDCVIGNNSEVGGYIVQGACVRFIGGSVEGNGSDTGATLRCGIKVEDCGIEGGVGLVAFGVYLEANEGTADIWVDHTTTNACSHLIDGCSFGRVGSLFSTNCVRFDCSSGTLMRGTVSNSAFRGFGGYTPNASRPYVSTSNCLGTKWYVSLPQNVFESAIETPAAVVDAEQFIALGSAYTLVSQTGAQKLFNSSTNGALTVRAGTRYFFECHYALTAMSATSGTFGFNILGAGTATLTSQDWRSTAIKGALATAGTALTAFNTAANTALTGNNTTTTGHAFINGQILVNAAGTIIPSVSLSVAAAAIVSSGSYFRIWPAGGSNTTQGDWS